MSLSETVGAAGLSIYAEAALLLFFAAFVGVLIQVLSKRSAGALDEVSTLPLDDTVDHSVLPTARKASEASRHGQ